MWSVNLDSKTAVSSKAMLTNLYIIAILLVCNYHNVCSIQVDRYLQDMPELVSVLREKGHLNDHQVAEVLLQVNRRYYSDKLNYAYEDIARSIGFFSILPAPSKIAYTLQLLKDHLFPGAQVLDVGSGSGFLSVCMALMVGGSAVGKVIAIDHIEQVIKRATYSATLDHPELLENGTLQFLCKDGKDGYPYKGPYDLIHVGFFMSEIPIQLVYQLKQGGRLFLPMGSVYSDQHEILLIDRCANNYYKISTGGKFIYNPYMKKEHQLQIAAISIFNSQGLKYKYTDKIIQDALINKSSELEIRETFPQF